MALENLNMTQNISQQGTLEAGRTYLWFITDLNGVFGVSQTFNKGSIFVDNGTDADVTITFGVIEADPIEIIVPAGETLQRSITEDNLSSGSIITEVETEGTVSYFFNLKQQVNFAPID